MKVYLTTKSYNRPNSTPLRPLFKGNMINTMQSCCPPRKNVENQVMPKSLFK